MEAITKLVTEELDYEIRDGIVYFGTEAWGGAMPLRIAKRSVAKFQRAIAEYEGRRAEVVRMPVAARG